MASKSNSPIGVYFNPLVKQVIEEAALSEGKSTGGYIRDLVQNSLGLPSGCLTKDKLRINELERENQRLRYEGLFNHVGFIQENIEIIDPMEIPNKLKKVTAVKEGVLV
jgi:hypothetical protein